MTDVNSNFPGINLTSNMEQNVTSLNLPLRKINKLQNLGKHYRSDLTETLLNSLSIDLPKVPQTTTALDSLEVELLHGAILSFNSELDKVLRDEITPGIITELAGFPGSGKTQICFQLCVTTQLPTHLGGVEGQVIYINTNKNFSSDRIRELTGKFKEQVGKFEGAVTEESILKNIYVFNINNIVEISATIKYLEEFLEDKTVKLLIIDNISSPLKDLDPKQRLTAIYKLFEDLQVLAAHFNFAIVITNDFTTKVKNNQIYQTPSFGDSFFDRMNSRICLWKYQDFHVAELIKSIVKKPLKVNFGMF